MLNIIIIMAWVSVWLIWDDAIIVANWSVVSLMCCIEMVEDTCCAIQLPLLISHKLPGHKWKQIYPIYDNFLKNLILTGN